MRNSIELAVQKYKSAQADVEMLLIKQRELTKRFDDTQESLPILQRNIEEKRAERQRMLDGYVLGEIEQSLFKKADEALLKAENDYKTAQEICEALQRQIKIIETNLPRKHSEVDLLKRQIWEAIAEEIKASIPQEISTLVGQLIICGTQTGKTRAWILDQLFPSLPSEKFQEIYKEIVTEYEIID